MNHQTQDYNHDVNYYEMHQAVFHDNLLEEIRSRLLQEDPDYRLLTEKRAFLCAALTAIKDCLEDGTSDFTVHAEQIKFIVDIIKTDKLIQEKEQFAIYIQGHLDSKKQPATAEFANSP